MCNYYDIKHKGYLFWNWNDKRYNDNHNPNQKCAVLWFTSWKYDWKSREISDIAFNTARCEIQGVHFIVSISTPVVTVDLSHRKPASAENLHHFKTPMRNKERCSSRGRKRLKFPDDVSFLCDKALVHRDKTKWSICFLLIMQINVHLYISTVLN